ncbi:hypothetical protein HYX10_05045 [Candidatus Woesearchaeota archaeon]|nr:hypothetical protein [Candidatus Woesearchaeota archaeon]
MLSLISIIAACGPSEPGKIPDVSEAFEGKQGLELSFFDNAPPETTVPGAAIPIAVLLENKGAADITCGDTSRADFGCGYFKVIAAEPLKVSPDFGLLKDALSSTGTAEIIGRENYLAGGRAAVEVKADVGAAKSTTSRTITALACYPYKTFVSTPVCVKTAHFSIPESSLVCEPSDIRLKNQGAPVAVTKIGQESLTIGETVRPRFKVYVEKVGKGTVLDSSDDALRKACTDEAGSEIGIVTVEKAELSGLKLDCEGQTLIATGAAKKEFIECSTAKIPEAEMPPDFAAGANNNIVSTLTLTLSYGFQTAASAEVEIEVLDEPPQLTAFRISPTEVTASQQVTASITANDDFGLLSVQMLDADGNLAATEEENPAMCEGKRTCTKQFKFAAPEAEGRYLYKAIAYDTLNRPSQTKTALVVIDKDRPVIDVFEMPAEATPGASIAIKVKASDESMVSSIELIGKDGKTIEVFSCADKICERTFSQNAPQSGEYSYTIIVRDQAGNTDSDTKKGKVVSP